MILWNDRWCDAEQALFSASNRAFRYGDAVFETFRYESGKVFWLEEHYFRLMAGMRVFRMEIPDFLTPEWLNERLIQTVDANHRGDKPTRLRFQVYREGAGAYLPQKSSVSWIAACDPLEYSGYSGAQKGLRIDLYRDHPIHPGLLSNLKTAQSAPYVLASIWSAENALDDALLLNPAKQLVEASRSNLFVLKEGVLYTPPLSSGCTQGVIRSRILELAHQWGASVVETELSPFELLRAEEIWLTNAVEGVRWVSAYRDHSYLGLMATKAAEVLHKAALV